MTKIVKHEGFAKQLKEVMPRPLETVEDLLNPPEYLKRGLRRKFELEELVRFLEKRDPS